MRTQLRFALQASVFNPQTPSAFTQLPNGAQGEVSREGPEGWNFTCCARLPEHFGHRDLDISDKKFTKSDLFSMGPPAFPRLCDGFRVQPV